MRFFGNLDKTAAKTSPKRKLLREPSPVRKLKLPKVETSPDPTVPSSETPEISEQPSEKLSQSAATPDSEIDEKDASKLIELAEESHKHPLLAPTAKKITYAKLTSVLDKIEAEPGRLKMTAIVVEFFTEILEQFESPDELVRVVYLFINRLGPDYEPDLELGLGETILIKAIGECYGRATAKIKKDYQEVGDLGLVAQRSRSGQPPMFKPTALDVDTVFENLTKIAKATGKDSQSKKIGIINKMLTSCDMKSSEAKFLIRSLEGKLRIGLAEKTVLVSLAQAFLNYENKSLKRLTSESLSKAEDVIREAFSVIPNYERYPDLVSIVKDFIKTSDLSNTETPKSMLLDCEAVAWDRETGKILPFRFYPPEKEKMWMRRILRCTFVYSRLTCYVFNGESLITRSLLERRKCLFDNFTPIEGKFQFATHKDSSDLNELQLFLDQSVKDACEGLMVKMLHGAESYYEPSKRSRNWLKLKKDYLAGVGDSLDLVVVGAYIGKGKRTGSYGGFLLAAYNDDTGEYETTCKIGTGFSDEDLASLHAKLKPTEISGPKAFYVYDTTNSNAVPDVWLEPTAVFEVLTADLSLSPIYKAAHLEYGKGISLRFPRFLRLREDKGVEDATTSSQVSEFYERQANLG
ncbi:hypothetical protein HF325_000044 [Metschnikowia pulcherrima]|uniref:DNA ligase 1 n=1 Tax=Metschnikowia pulcherrima TaxID=27326 RepID=A0A8H7LH07_9ASCO|nr:hypothetical protein HF325_000044 [Metschnikowia pulcherrima]